MILDCFHRCAALAAMGVLCTSSGCNDAPRDKDGDASGFGTDAATAEGSSSGTTSGTAGGEASAGSGSPEGSDTNATSSDDGIRLDVAPNSDFPGGGGGCEKVDFLFVIDNSNSMQAEQDKLIAAFPRFIESIRDTVQGQDHHIMVIDTDEHPGWVCETYNEPFSHCQGGHWDSCASYTCGSVPTDDACHTTLGAGVTAPYGGGASNRDCGIAAGRRYMTSGDDDVEATFRCAAQVGVTGNWDEFPMTGLSAALNQLAQPGECNDGFLRDDAILVITIVTDDDLIGGIDDAGNNGSPSLWRQAVVDAKGGNEEAVVVVGLVPYEDTSCGTLGRETQRFIDFVEGFERHTLGSACSDDYAEIFDEAIAPIAQACIEFVPAG